MGFIGTYVKRRGGGMVAKMSEPLIAMILCLEAGFYIMAIIESV